VEEEQSWADKDFHGEIRPDLIFNPIAVQARRGRVAGRRERGTAAMSGRSTWVCFYRVT